ncbi:MAG: hypothetical protein EX254_04700 [Flavobacteriaceae bacterium]|nr:MAG: hypothetical protein EX254_04700 [Flavobacteriaceae bacterium]
MNKGDLFNDEMTSTKANPGDQPADKFLDEVGFDDNDMDQDNPALGQDTGDDIASGDDDPGTLEPAGMDDLFPQEENDDEDFPTWDPAYDDVNTTQSDKEDLNQDNENTRKEPEENPELDALNKQLGTNYNSMEDLKKALAGEKQEEEISTELPPEKIESYQKNNRNINFLAKEHSKSDMDLVRDTMMRDIRSRNDGEISEDDMDHIETKIETMDMNGTLDMRADRIREKIQNNIEKLKGENTAIEQERNNLIAKANEKLLNNVQDHMVSFANEDFYGVKLEKDKVLDAYNGIKSNDFFEKLGKNPKLMTEVALFLQYRDVIRQKASGPTYSDGVKSVFSELETGSSKGAPQVASGTTGHGKSKSLKTRWLD